jgi:predicted aminopeptidase
MTKVSLPILLLAISLHGCSSLGYYGNAVGGHIEVMQATRPIAELIEDPKCDPALKKNLEEVRLIRDFASSDLGLPNNDSYRSYADIKRPFVTWNVFAAPEFSLQNMNWCMLVVGCVGYRGFHDKGEAEKLADELRQQGFDTYVGGVPAYSTLGYFSDPVLNTFLKFGNLEVARLIFHELSHQVLYIEGDTVFNESFATAVENEGLRRWLAHKNTPELGNAVTAHQKRHKEVVELVANYRGRLQQIYDSDIPTDAKRSAKAGVISELRNNYLDRQQAQGTAPVHREWFELHLNNAKMATLGMYTQLLPEFEALIEAEDHDLPRFYRRVAELASLPFSERRAALGRIQPGTLRLSAGAAVARNESELRF